tara:strand:- start:8819 stop:10252 length:1434 start_codon:yes stop_codon:yes gene_type:complete
MGSDNLLLIDIKHNYVDVSICNSYGKTLDHQQRLFDCQVSSEFGRHVDANEFLYATRSAINQLIVSLPKRQSVDQIGIVGNMDSFLFCDQKTGMVLTPSFYLEDDRALDIYMAIKNTSIVKDYESITHQVLSRYSLFTHLKWFVEKGVSFFSFSPQKSVCMSLELYLLFNLTGLDCFQQDFVTASSSGFFDFIEQDFSSIIIKDLNLNRSCFPELVSPFLMEEKSKGFIPLNDGIPINFMTHSSVKNWLFESNIVCGSLNIHIAHNYITLEQHIGLEINDFDNSISKSFVVKGKESFYCLKDLILVPNFSSDLFSAGFSDILSKELVLSDSRSWIILNPDSYDSTHEFALINHDVASSSCSFEKALIEGLFNVLRLKLQIFESSSSIQPHTFYCTSSCLVDESVWQLCADILQHPLIIVDMDQSSIGLINEMNYSRQNSKKELKTCQLKTIIPAQDPISSYARYQTWVTYYQKIFKN